MISSKMLLQNFQRVSLVNIIARGFTKMSARDKVPNLIKDPRFTRTGMSKRKTRDRTYDLTQPHIKNPELYYDQKVDRPLERKKQRELHKLKRGLPEVDIGQPRELKNILADLTNPELLTKGSSRLMVNIHELQKWHQDKIESNLDAIHGALRVLNHRLPLLSFREFGIVTTLNDRYNPNDKQIWTDISLNLQRAIQGWVEYERDVIAVNSLKKNLIHVSNSVYNAAKRLDINIESLSALLRQTFQDKIDSIKDTKELILFYTTLSKMPGEVSPTLLSKVAERALKNKQNVEMVDIVWLIHALSKTKSDNQALDQLVNVFIEKFNTKKTEQRVDRVAIVAQSLANARLSHTKFAELAGKYIESNLNQLKNVKDLCFIAESFVKLAITNPKVFKHIEKELEAPIENLNFNLLRQLIYSARGNPNYSSEFVNKLYARLKKIVEVEVASKDTSLTNKDIDLIIKNCSNWDTPDGKFTQTDVYHTLIAAIGGERNTSKPALAM